MSALRPSLSFDEPPPLQACLQAARAEAQRFFGARPTASWQPRRAPVRRPAWVLGALAAVGAAAAAAAMAWPRPTARPPAPPQASAAAWIHPAVMPAGDAVDGPIAEAPPAAAPVPTVMPEVPSASGADARIEVGADGHVQIALERADRAGAARRLAELTGTRLLEQPQALAGTPPVTLHWQGRDAMAAWRALLADATPHAIDCRDMRACKVWIFGAAAVMVAPAANAADAAPAASGLGPAEAVADPMLPQ